MADDSPASPEESPIEPEPSPMPPWVPTLIGVVLVALAALAVWTGVRYRNPPLAGGVVKATKRVPRATTGGGVPGEPEPGSSLMFPGDTPNANAPVSGRARAEISGGGTQGINTTMRTWARRGIIFHVVPEDAIVAINGVVIGEARQFSGPNEDYDFPAPGSYTVHITAAGYRDQTFVVTAAENARDELAKIDVKMTRQ
jgi:hypothetical protein